jgi:hypothetical protein
MEEDVYSMRKAEMLTTKGGKKFYTGGKEEVPKARVRWVGDN